MWMWPGARCNIPPSRMTLALEKPNAWALCWSSIWNLPGITVASKPARMEESGIFHPVPHPLTTGLLKGWFLLFSHGNKSGQQMSARDTCSSCANMRLHSWKMKNLKFSPETTKHILLPMKILQAKHSLLVDPINKCIAPTNLGAWERVQLK
jgi:hypothetical protein